MAPKHAQLQIFIQANITVEKKTKNLPRMISGHFIKVFYKTTTFEWSQEWLVVLYSLTNDQPMFNQY